MFEMPRLRKRQPWVCHCGCRQQITCITCEVADACAQCFYCPACDGPVLPAMEAAPELALGPGWLYLENGASIPVTGVTLEMLLPSGGTT